LALVVHASLLCDAAQSPQDDTFKFESKVRVVMVPVVVRDAKGQVIEDLKKEDFEIFDRGKRRPISHFTVQKRAGVSKGTQAAPTAPPAAEGQHIKKAAERYIIFLFDDMHLPPGDLSRVRSAAIRMLADSVKSEDAAAVVSTSGEVNSGFTRNRAKLEDAIGNLWLHTLYKHVRDCPNVSYYEADLILNIGDPDALAVATTEARMCAGVEAMPKEMARSAAERELALGNQATHATLQAIRAVVRSIGAAPGQRTVVLISPGFYVASSALAHGDVSKLLDTAAQGNVMISALDARGLYTEMLDASERGKLPSDIDPTGNLMRVKDQNRRDSMSAEGAIMDELASGTGGTYFHNSNDLEGGFERVTMSPECVYLLEFSAQDAPPDGSFHRLSIKVDKQGAKVRARSGYFSEKPAERKKKDAGSGLMHPDDTSHRKIVNWRIKSILEDFSNG